MVICGIYIDDAELERACEYHEDAPEYYDARDAFRHFVEGLMGRGEFASGDHREVGKGPYDILVHIDNAVERGEYNKLKH